jgi:hypothetical protein
MKFKFSHKFAAAFTAGSMLGLVGEARADVMNFVTLSSNITTATSGFQDMISLLGYLGGSGMAVAGIFKLKQHVDAPGNVPMKDGLMRLAAGGALLSLPFMISAMQGSISNGNYEGPDGGFALKSFSDTVGGTAPG